MATGAGKYDEECTEVMKKTQAAGILLIVIDGFKGGGFSAQMTPEHMKKMPGILRIVAEQIERDMEKQGEDFEKGFDVGSVQEKH